MQATNQRLRRVTELHLRCMTHLNCHRATALTRCLYALWLEGLAIKWQAAMCSGNLVGLALAPFLIQRVGWRGLFYVFGVLGIPAWLFWQHAVPDQTVEEQGSRPKSSPLSAWTMMSKPATWAIITVNFVNHWGGATSYIQFSAYISTTHCIPCGRRWLMHTNWGKRCRFVMRQACGECPGAILISCNPILANLPKA